MALVQFLAGALESVLGQGSLFHIASVYLAIKWVPSINTTVLRASALYAAVLSIGEMKWFPCVNRPARGGRSFEHFRGYKTINRIHFTFYLWSVILL